MRSLIVVEFVTLDGILQSPGRLDEDTSGDFRFGGWIGRHSDPVAAQIIRSQMNQPFDLLLGRKTFEIWASYWPQHEAAWPEVNRATKYVVSRTLRSHAWRPSVFLGEDVAQEVRRLKAQEGPPLMVYGSATVVQTLMQNDLVDEFWLRIHPITLGTGKRLFAEGTRPSEFRVTESTVTPSGVVMANYRRSGAIMPAGEAMHSRREKR